MKKFLFDLFPLILFFVAYRFADIYVATAVAMVAAVGQIAYIKIRRQPIEGTHWINLIVIVVFGASWFGTGATALWWSAGCAYSAGHVRWVRHFRARASGHLCSLNLTCTYRTARARQCVRLIRLSPAACCTGAK